MDDLDKLLRERNALRAAIADSVTEYVSDSDGHILGMIALHKGKHIVAEFRGDAMYGTGSYTICRQFSFRSDARSAAADILNDGNPVNIGKIDPT